MEGLSKIYGRSLDCVVVPGSFRPNGATGVVTNSEKGQGWSVARTSAGLYTVTFDEVWQAKETVGKGPGLISFIAGLRLAAATGGAYSAFGSVVSQSAGTAQIRVYGPGGGIGFAPMDHFSLREIASNALQNLAAHGGLMAKDSTPRIERINGATDPTHRVRWGSADDTEVVFPNIPIPADLDPSEDVYVKLLMGKSGETNTTSSIAIEFRECGVMDAAAGMFANTDANNSDLGDSVTIHNTEDGQAGGNAKEYSLTIAAAGLSGPPGFFNIGLTPANHNNDAFDLYGAYLEYTSTTRGRQLTDLASNADHEVDFIAIIQDCAVAA